MVSPDLRAKQFRKAVPIGNRFRYAWSWNFLSARRAQRGDAGEFVFVYQVRDSAGRRLNPQMNTDKH
jgi:hypothetical protein